MLNDLVREFSMQCHLERFAISAKGFFHVNLDSLGSVSEKNTQILIDSPKFVFYFDIFFLPVDRCWLRALLT